ncbi:ATP synthase subunit delta [Planctomycetes bacterium Pla163]|uniref:ATP synthase subunit delta n=1 Tax=Rohdeia mirabilis TaxID=2528008 RepID=A0A518D052_9BACT|nr:ATP synthase subunit delta [Planctomycetes bacterium Pla163]
MIGQVAQRYADALYNLAAREGALDAVASDVSELAKAIGGEKASHFLLNPRVDRDKREAALLGTLSGAHALTTKFARLCFSKGREAVLLELGEAFRLRQMAEDGVVEGVVESARPLDHGEIASLATNLSARLGKTVQLDNRIDASLIGGVRVTVGSSMLDLTVQGRLDDLRERLMRVPLTAGR